MNGPLNNKLHTTNNESKHDSTSTLRLVTKAHKGSGAKSKQKKIDSSECGLGFPSKQVFRFEPKHVLCSDPKNPVGVNSDDDSLPAVGVFKG